MFLEKLLTYGEQQDINESAQASDAIRSINVNAKHQIEKAEEENDVSAT